MSQSDLIAEGQSITLGPRIGRGGEGEVFAISNKPGLAVKLYTKPDKAREAKIEAMVAARLHASSPLIAFPIAGVRHRTGAFAGFSMKLVNGHRPLHELYAPGARKQTFPKADFRFLVRSALNISVAVAQVHKAGCVIGDINHSGILISDKAIAALIDADSFQFGTQFPCRVGVPEYTPPELQGRNLGSVERSPTHDAFGLAVVIFQMLFMGRHPFVGRFASGDVTISQAIARSQFVYSNNSTTGVRPPPASASLDDFPTDLGSLFEAAFDGNYSHRPRAEEWVTALKVLERSLSRCRENELHYFPTSSGSCLWCKLEQASGVVLFEQPLPSGAVAPDPGDANFDLDAAWKAIAAVKIPRSSDLNPAISVSAPSVSPDIEDLIGQRRTRVFSGVALMIGAAVVAGFDLGLWLLYLPIGIWGYMRAYHSSSEFSQVTQRYRSAHDAYQKSLSDWHRRIGFEELHSRLGELNDARTQYAGLADSKQKALSQLHSNRQQAQLLRYLEKHRIRPGKISGIGRGKVASLASYGIDTAAEIQRNRILAIQGFGPATTQALLEWKADLTSRFRYNRNMTPQDHDDIQRTEQKFAAEAARLRRMLSGGASELRQTAALVASRAKRLDPSLNKAAQDLEQAKVDLTALGLAIPNLPSPTSSVPASAKAPPNSRTGRVGNQTNSPSCPQCQSRMVRRLARRGRNRGGHFWGCSRYPRCTGTRSI